ncbi:MAG: hypothetical protein O2854_04515 [Chloroflexi bacterium]|nr:hypothetical protein [Chloroflexota bacterium]
MDANGSKPADTHQEVLDEFRKAVEGGQLWPEALMDAMSAWPLAEEVYRRKRYNYFIAGQAFDWLLLAERILHATNGLVPAEEQEALVLYGTFPPDFDEGRLKERLGVEKHSGYLNYFYGVTVEEALQLAVEEHANKRFISNGIRYRIDLTDEAFKTIYGGPVEEMLEKFREATHTPRRQKIALRESKEFTYWLFKYRVKKADPARLASDTKRGLDQLQKMRDARSRRRKSTWSFKT